jgi:hypothetical protein
MKDVSHKPDFVINNFENDFFPMMHAVESFTTVNPTFFRGHGQSDWPLIPELGRPENSYVCHPIRESIIFRDFEANAHMDLSELSVWDTLFAMRHHGLPTRLLDWTDSISVALFFAIRDFENFSVNKPKEKINNLCLWVLEPFALNLDEGLGALVLTKTNKQYVYDYFLGEVKEKKSDDFPARVIALYPPKSNERLLAQSGFFTFHKDLSALEIIKRRFLFKIEINKSQVENIKRYLDFVGMKESYLFPDLDGLSRYLKSKYKTRWK